VASGDAHSEEGGTGRLPTKVSLRMRYLTVVSLEMGCAMRLPWPTYTGVRSKPEASTDPLLLVNVICRS